MSNTMTTLYSSLVDCFTDQPHLPVNDKFEEMCHHHQSSDCYLLNEDNLCDYRQNSSHRNNANTTSNFPLQSLIWSQTANTDTKCQMPSKKSLPETTLRRHRFAARRKSQKLLCFETQHSIHFTFFITLCYLLALSVSLCEASKSKRNSWRQYDAPSSIQPSSTSTSQQSRLHFLQQQSHIPSSESTDAHAFASPSRSSYGSYVGSSTSHNRRPPPPPTAASLQSAYQHYMGNHLLSVPFSPNQQLLYQHQMLPHHSTFTITPTASVVSGSSAQQKHHTIVHKSIPTSGRNIKMAQQQQQASSSSSSSNHHQQYDINQEHMLQTNSLRGKNAKWW